MKPIENVLIIIQVSFFLTGCLNNIHENQLECRISHLINQMTLSEESGTAAFTELESMGIEIVPHLICHLNDMRPVAMSEITLENDWPSAFEALRHYGPKTVHDALAAILNQITGQRFLFVYNGATPQEREENRKKWIVWYNSTYAHAHQLEPCK